MSSGASALARAAVAAARALRGAQVLVSAAHAPAASCIRGFASEAPPSAESAVPPPLKSLLRQLFLRVHPDLFTDAPQEQATNQRSFILLQEYLSLAESGSEPHGRAQAFAFEFFLRDDKASGAGADNHSAPGNSNGLRRVAVTLPPPGRRQPGQSGGGLPPATALALGKLLSACGLESAFTGGVGDGAPDGLLDVLPTASEALRQHETAARGPDDIIRMARAALRMGRGIMLSFAPSAPAAPAARAELAQRLTAALDASPEGHLRGAAIVLADRYGVHPGTGAVFLDCAGAASGAWPARLMAVDVAAATAAREAAAARKAAEASLAASMQVALVCADDALGRSAAYGDFMARLRITAAARGPAGGGALRDVPIRVGPAPATDGAPGAGGATAGFEIVAREGLLCVPITAVGDDVYAFLAHEGPSAAATRAALAAAERRAADAAIAARRALRLRHLLRAEALPPQAFEAGCARLLRFRAALAPHAEGLSMRIVAAGAAPALSPDGAHLDVPADFELRRSGRHQQ